VTDKVLSVSADGQVRSTPLADFAGSRRLADFAGETVIGCHLEADGERLWLALEEGRVVWMDPRDGNQQGELQLPEHRVEELRPGARPGEVMVLTDRGSLKRLSLV
jgi:sugar lactone lactonase YvrE